MNEKKVILLTFVLLLSSTITVARPVKVVAASLPIHNVDSGFDYATIQEAVEAPETLDGHRIVVDPGTYHENLIAVGKQLSIIASSIQEETVIVAKQGTGFSIGANSVTIQGFSLRNITNSGIVASRVEHTKIVNNTILGNHTSYSTGIRLDNSPYSNLTGNTLTSFELGIELRDSTNCTLSGNKAVSNEEMGIRLMGSHGCEIIGNEATQNGNGGIVIFSHWNTVKDNKATFNEGYGILLKNSISNDVINNTASNSKDGLGIIDSTGCKLDGNTVKSNRDYGIRLIDPEGVILTNNIMENNSFNFGAMNIAMPDSSYMFNIDTSNMVDGKRVYYIVNQTNLVVDPTAFPDLGFLAVVNSRNIIVKGLTLKNNIVGILLANTNDSVIEDVNVLNNEFGVLLHRCSNVTVKNSYATSNDKSGIELSRSNQCAVINNSISLNGANIVCDNVIGIGGGYGLGVVSLSENCTIAKNTILDNYAGIFLNARYNSFFYNNLINNTKQLDYPQPQFLPVPNRWDNIYEGNFWSNYEGVDKNDDGVGDNILPHEHVDYYPLLGPYKEFIITAENKTYPVDIISNSSPDNLQFSVSEKSLSFTVSVKADTLGFSRLTLPHELLSGPYTVTVDDLPPILVTENLNGTHTRLYFTYSQSAYQVEIVGTTATVAETPVDFNWWMIPVGVLSVLAVAAIAFFIIRKRRGAKKTIENDQYE